MQITRQRVRPAVEVDVMEVCPTCQGKGKIQPSILFTDQVEEEIKHFTAFYGKGLRLHLHPYVYSYASRGWWNSLKNQWRRKYGVRLVENQSLGMLEMRFCDEKGNILKHHDDAKEQPQPQKKGQEPSKRATTPSQPQAVPQQPKQVSQPKATQVSELRKDTKEQQPAKAAKQPQEAKPKQPKAAAQPKQQPKTSPSPSIDEGAQSVEQTPAANAPKAAKPKAPRPRKQRPQNATPQAEKALSVMPDAPTPAPSAPSATKSAIQSEEK